jgi:hypothetical protein
MISIARSTAQESRRVSKKNRSAVALGRRGGKATSDRKARASRENGKKGGRPKMDAEAKRRAAEERAADYEYFRSGTRYPGQ